MSQLTGTGVGIERAIDAMRHEYRDNEWMLKEYWPLNEPHARLMIKDIAARFPASPNVRLLDVGCMNGYMSVIFKQLGYHVTGTDGWELENRRAIFDRAGIDFFYSNMNDPHPFGQVGPESFDVVIIAQVIEHILNHPLGLIRSLAKIMRPRRADDSDDTKSFKHHGRSPNLAGTPASLGHPGFYG